MKRILLLPALLLAGCSIAQNVFTGSWEGKLVANTVELRIVFRIAEDKTGRLTVQVNCPDQGIKDLDAGSPIIRGDSIHIHIARFQAHYDGQLNNDSLINGVFTQGIATLLQFRKFRNSSTRRRPQTPVGPFPYRSEDIVYSGSEGPSATAPPLPFRKVQGCFRQRC